MASWRNASLRRRFAATVVLLAALLAVLGPEATRGLAWPAAVAFWLASVGVGLGFAVAAARALAVVPALSRRGTLLLAIAGLVGLACYTPFGLWLESTWLPPPVPEPDDDWLDAWEREGGWRALAAESIQAAPAYLAAWALVNLPAWSGGASSIIVAPVGGEPGDDGVTSGASSRPVLAAIAATSSQTPSPDAGEQDAFLARLPPAIGRELVVITADLHYLQVETRKGRATLLGGLAEAERALGCTGLRIHRSHWVAFDAVRRVARGSNGWYCELSTGARLPIGRRRVGEVKARLGADFVVDRVDAGATGASAHFGSAGR